jgi:phage host-nuclease inhibitor protein Gam
VANPEEQGESTGDLRSELKRLKTEMEEKIRQFKDLEARIEAQSDHLEA